MSTENPDFNQSRRDFLKLAGASLTCLGLEGMGLGQRTEIESQNPPSSLQPSEVLQEEEDNLLNQFCSVRPDVCLSTSFTDNEGKDHQIVVVEHKAFMDFVSLNQKSEETYFFATILRIMGDLYWPLEVENNDDLWLEAAGHLVDLKEGRAASNSEQEKFGFPPYCLFFEKIPEDQRTIDHEKHTPEEILTELDQGGPYEYRKDFLRDDVLFLRMKDLEQAETDGVLTSETMTAYLKALTDYLMTDFVYEAGYFNVREKYITSNILLNRVPKIGDCSETARAQALFSYLHFPEIFPQGSVIRATVTHIDSTRKENFAGHGFTVLKPDIPDEQGRKPFYIIDNDFITNVNGKDSEKLNPGPYYSLEEIEQAIWEKTRYSNLDIGWLSFRSFIDIERSLQLPYAELYQEAETIERFFINPESKEFFKNWPGSQEQLERDLSARRCMAVGVLFLFTAAGVAPWLLKSATNRSKK